MLETNKQNIKQHTIESLGMPSFPSPFPPPVYQQQKIIFIPLFSVSITIHPNPTAIQDSEQVWSAKNNNVFYEYT